MLVKNTANINLRLFSLPYSDLNTIEIIKQLTLVEVPGKRFGKAVKTMAHLIESKRADDMVHGLFHTVSISSFRVKIYS